MEKLMMLVEEIKMQYEEKQKVVNQKQQQVCELMRDLDKLTQENHESSKVFETVGTMLVNLADDLREQSCDVRDWGNYDLAFDIEDDEGDDICDDEDDIAYVECENCGDSIPEYDAIYDDVGMAFCHEACMKEYNENNN